MKTKIRKITFNVCLFITSLLILDLCIGMILKHFYFLQTSGLNYNTTYSFEKTDQDIIVLGSSRASHHYTPVLGDSLNMSFYNAGRASQYIFYYYATLECILKRYSPKFIILDIRYDELEEADQAYETISTLLPYYGRHSEISEVIDLKGSSEKIRLLSNIYPYNSLILSIAMGNLGVNKNRFYHKKGYIPLHGIYSIPVKPHTNLNSIDKNKVNIYSKIINECKRRNIKLVVSISPYYFKIKKTESTKIATAIAKKNGILFMDFSNLLTEKPEYFKDRYHLNDKGAELFSATLASRLKSFTDYL